ncbi:LysE/ArgO family amino acid transporter [Solicola gregarius]|uniref:LysE/ArgO family amino acid transporter n=1 Tax=Solicola gregarius TaxID=2908642 RepID=A0AA46YN78_9ACTN|nr:LysE/ArgO family amino acid transporter [Solicola gregarius]UYM06463.1 LysE/ArgO family amino acid transporter [Solicola gregarius]
MNLAFLIGFATSAGLIIAIGAQNAYVLRQGLRREYVAAVVVVCAGADMLLISVGIVGLGEPLRAYPTAFEAVRYAGAAFLLCYGVLAARRAMRPAELVASGGQRASLRVVVLTCLGLTFLNPHVYLDTVLTLGSIANQYRSGEQWWFGAGAVAASLTWFVSLGWGARLLGPLFSRPRAWRILDAMIAAMMLGLGGWMLAGGPAA